MTDNEQKELDELREKERKQKERIKRQNEEAKKRWETVSCRLPKGTKARIEETGETLNGLINRLVLGFLDQAGTDPKPQPAADPQEIPPQRSEDIPEPITEPEEPKRTPTYAELQAQLEEKQRERGTVNNICEVVGDIRARMMQARENVVKHDFLRLYRQEFREEAENMTDEEILEVLERLKREEQEEKAAQEQKAD